MPVRPIPHCTSSKINAAPCSSHASRAAASSSSERTCTPVSPWIGSSSTAAVRPSTAARSASASAATARKPGTSGTKGACLASCGVADSAPYVRPWKAPWTTTTSPAARSLRASLIAASLASAPELQKNTLPPRLDSDRRAARRMPGSV